MANGKKKKGAKKVSPGKPSGPHQSSDGESQSSSSSSPNLAVKRGSTEEAARFPVVGIGASAGGLEAMEELLDAMPVDTGMAFVVVTHQHPGHASLLPELLSRETEMTVIEATDGTRLEPNHVYVGQPGGYLAVLNGTLHRMETEKTRPPKLPIDHFFRSLAEDQGERAICIILSGTGSDGTLGLRAIKGESGMAMVQEPQSARYSGMPSSAMATGLADYVLPSAEIPRQLVAYARGPYFSAVSPVAKAPGVAPVAVQKIFVLLRERTGHDFSAYKSSTIRRRIERRMNVHQIKKPNQYVKYLQDNPQELDSLFKELLINVTNFFRDPPAWDALEAGIVGLLETRPDDYTLRAWVPGCASGEEVFSLAILLRECMEQVKRRLEVQIFGTDLDADAIDDARLGRFPEGIGVDVSPKRLERYFLHDGSSYRIRTDIREMTIFAPQNVIKDPPFTKLDILSCRNLLIYLNADLQKRLLPIFHYALKPGGLLILGPSESISGFDDLFEILDKKWKIYRRKEAAVIGNVVPQMPAARLPKHLGSASPPTVGPEIRKPNVSALIEKVMLSTFCPASVVVSERGDIVHVQGRTGEYLELAEGEARTNVLDMAREGLTHELASAMRQAAAGDTEVVRDNLRVKTSGGYATIDLSVVKLREPKPLAGLLMASFRPTRQPQKSIASEEKQPDRVADLENELQYMRESHQTTLEELETSNEELKSTNEELQSTNEELQSANEEMETSKEELQSLNEELTTVNAELQSKLDELSEANDDMQNLLNSTSIATIFLDNELNIKRYTDQATRLIMLRRTDIGRPISELASNLKYDHLAKDCRNVLKTLESREVEIVTRDGGQYLLRVMPYRTSSNVIDGLVLTFVDIARVAFSESIVDTVREPILVLDDELRVVTCNPSFCRIFSTKKEQAVGELVYELGGAQWDVKELRRLLEEVLPRDITFEDCRVSADFPRLGRRTFALNARRLERGQDLPGMILLAMEDVAPSSA